MIKRRDMPTTVYVSLRRIICVRSRTVSLSRNAGFRKNLKSRFSSQGAFLHRVREISFFSGKVLRPEFRKVQTRFLMSGQTILPCLRGFNGRPFMFR